MPYIPTLPESLTDGDFISFHLSRKTVESNNLSHSLRNLPRLLETSEIVRKFQDKMIIHLSGYDDDPRPLWEISAARLALQTFDREFPVWLHFCEKENDSLQLMILCLTPLTTISTDMSILAVTTEQLIEIVNDRVKAAHLLQIENGFSKKEREDFAQSAVDYLMQMHKRFFRPKYNG